MFDDQLLQRFMTTFYGYGNYHGGFWFIGMEEGGGNSFTNVQSRITSWYQRGEREVEDLAEFHNSIHMSFFFEGKAKLQNTWNKLIRVIFSVERTNCTTEDVREYQKKKLARSNSNNCLIELLPLPSPSTSQWMYGNHSALPQLSDRSTYRDYYIEDRAKTIRSNILKYQPKLVSFYSVSPLYQYWWRFIADVQFDRFDDGWFLGRNEHTVFVIMKHPATKGIANAYFQNIGAKIADYMIKD